MDLLISIFQKPQSTIALFWLIVAKAACIGAAAGIFLHRPLAAVCLCVWGLSISLSLYTGIKSMYATQPE